MEIVKRAVYRVYVLLKNYVVYNTSFTPLCLARLSEADSD